MARGNDAILAVVRPIVSASIVSCLVLAVTLAMGASAQAQSGEVYVPPGYGGAPTVTGTVVVPAPGGPAVTGAVSSYPAAYPAPPPVAPHLETRTRETSIRGLWIPGLIGLPASWLVTWVVSATSLPLSGDAIELSFIPVLGPWLMLTQTLNGYDGFAITMGILQGASALMLILGLTLRETIEEQVWVTSDLGEGRSLAFDVTGGPGGGMSTATLTF